MAFVCLLGVTFTYSEEQTGNKDTAVDVKLYSHRWRRWILPKPHTMDSNRASQEQDQQPDQEEPESFPGLLSAEERDNSSQIEVSVESRPGCDATVQTPFFIFNDGFYLNMAELKKDAMNHR